LRIEVSLLNQLMLYRNAQILIFILSIQRSMLNVQSSMLNVQSSMLNVQSLMLKV